MTDTVKPKRARKAKTPETEAQETEKKNGHGGARQGAGRTSTRRDVQAFLKLHNHDTLKRLMKASDDARDRDDHKLHVQIEMELLSYETPKPRAEQVVVHKTDPVKEMLEALWEEAKAK